MLTSNIRQKIATQCNISPDNLRAVVFSVGHYSTVWICAVDSATEAAIKKTLRAEAKKYNVKPEFRPLTMNDVTPVKHGQKMIGSDFNLNNCDIVIMVVDEPQKN